MDRDAEYHRQRTREGMANAAAHGRPTGRPKTVSDVEIGMTLGMRTMDAAAAVGLSKGQYIARRREVEKKLDEIRAEEEWLRAHS